VALPAKQSARFKAITPTKQTMNSAFEPHQHGYRANGYINRKRISNNIHILQAHFP
jgi:hypothetical protein